MWGPFNAQNNAYYEFVVEVPGQLTTHIYRSPFLRGSNYLYLRPGQFAKGDETAGSVVTMSRPRGYFGVGRDRMSLDGKPPAAVNEGVPGASTAKVVLPAMPQRTVVAIFRSETIPARNWPVADKQISIAEFTNYRVRFTSLQDSSSALSSETIALREDQSYFRLGCGTGR